LAKHNHTGKEGELLAAAYLQQNGYTLLHQNWRHGHWEVDIIATKNETLHFIEVKTRRNQTYGLPEESVNKKKLQTLQNAGSAFLQQQPQWKKVQYDVLSVSLQKSGVVYFLIEDVYLF
jgi:putative endonuclease